MDSQTHYMRVTSKHGIDSACSRLPWRMECLAYECNVRLGTPVQQSSWKIKEDLRGGWGEGEEGCWLAADKLCTCTMKIDLLNYRHCGVVNHAPQTLCEL